MIRSLLLPLFLFFFLGTLHAEDTRPNLVLVLAPELGCDWISCYGSDHQTPHLDRLAQEGIRYETAWSMLRGEETHRTLLSGRYPCRQSGDPIPFVKLLVDAGYSRVDFDFDREFERPAQAPFLLLCQLPAPTGEFADHVTHLDRLVGKLADDTADENTFFLFMASSGSSVGGKRGDLRYPQGNGAEADWGAHVPLIIRAPFLLEGGRVSRDLIDATDLYPTLLELTGIAPPEDLELDGRSLVPSLRGSDDPFDKRNWIFSEAGEFRMARDWHHVLDNRGNFHDLDKDPLQEHEVSVLDKQAPHRRERLQMILDRLSPETGTVSSSPRLEATP